MVRARVELAAHLRGPNGRGAVPMRPMRAALAWCAAACDRGLGDVSVWRLRAGLALPLAEVGAGYMGSAPTGITPRTRLPGPVWACAVEYWTRGSRNPRPPARRPWAWNVALRSPETSRWTAQDRAVTLAEWVASGRRHRANRRSRVEAIGLGWVIADPVETIQTVDDPGQA